MKKSIIILVCVALLVIVGLLIRSHFRGSSSGTAYATTVQLSGTPGAAFTGEYVCGGKRVQFSGVLPWSLTESNISSLEVRKSKMDDLLTFSARGGGSSTTVSASSNSKGIRLTFAGGWSVQVIK